MKTVSWVFRMQSLAAQSNFDCVHTRGSKHWRLFCPKHTCGVQTGLASLPSLLSSGFFPRSKREVSLDYGEGARAGETNRQWSTKAFHHFSLWAINNPHVHAVPGLQEGSFFGFHYSYGQTIRSRLLKQTVPTASSPSTACRSFCLYLWFESGHCFNFFFSFTSL